jgi:hypothetical protein
MATATGKVRIEGSAATGQIERAVTRIRGDIQKLDRTTGRLANTAEKAAGGFKAFVSAVAAEQVLSAFGDLIQSTVNARIEIKNLATEAGTTAELFGALKTAADQTGASTDQISGAFKALTAKIGDAASENKEAVKQFEDLDVAIRDASGELRNVDDVFRDVVRELGHIQNETDRAAEANRIFGEAAFGLRRALGELSERGLKQAEERTRAFTKGLGEDGLKAAEQFEQATNKVKIATQSVGDLLTDTLAGSINGLIDPLIYISVLFADTFGATLSDLVATIEMAGTALLGLAEAFARYSVADFAGAKQALADTGDALTKIREEAGLSLNPLQALADNVGGAHEKAQQIVASMRDATGALKGFSEASADAGSDFQLTNEQLAGIDPLTGEIIQKAATAIDNVGKKAKDAKSPVSTLKKELESLQETSAKFAASPFSPMFAVLAKSQNEALKDAGDKLTAYHLHNLRLLEEEKAQIEASIEAQDRAIATREAAASSAVALGELVQRIAGFYLDQATASGELSEEQRRAAITAFNVQKAAGIATAIVNTAIGVTQALAAAPPPVNFVQAALVGAAGAVSIAEIAAQQPSFALGGVMPTTGSPAILHPGEGVLSAGAVDAIGGASALAGANARRGGGGQVVNVQWKHLRSSFYHEARDGSRRPGALRDLRRDGRRAGQRRYTMRKDNGAL